MATGRGMISSKKGHKARADALESYEDVEFMGSTKRGNMVYLEEEKEGARGRGMIIVDGKKQEISMTSLVSQGLARRIERDGNY